MISIPTLVLKSALTGLVAEDALFDAVKVGLFTNNVTPSADTVLADLTPATFHGYALSSAVVWGTPFINDDGIPQVLGDLKQFTATSGSPANMPETVYGWYLVDGAGTTLLAAELFDEPVEIEAAGEGAAVVPYLATGNMEEAA